MSTGLATRPNSNGSESDEMIVRPQQTVGIAAAQSRVIAEAQAALTVAAARPRDEIACLDNIKTACQRKRLAEKAEYEYSKGGTAIAGASIKLLEAIATYWGNIQSGFRETARNRGESTVEAFAWDLQSNTKKTLEFTVKHWIDTKGGGRATRDEREIYELMANMAQRRVRKCLEGVIPQDIIDEAVDECRRTLKANVELTPERIKTMAEKFQTEFKVTKEQIETRIQRHLSSITEAQFLGLMRIYNSLKDGMSKPADHFGESEEPAAKPADTIKDKLREKAAPSQTEPESDEPNQDAPPISLFDRIQFQQTRGDVEILRKQLLESEPDRADEINAACDKRRAEIKPKG